MAIEKQVWSYGTRFVWNSVRSTFRAPSNLREAVVEDSLANKVVKVSVVWVLNMEVSMTDVIYDLIVYYEGTIRVLQSGVGGEGGIVGLNHINGNLGSE